jgi:hypothetical protein
MDKEQIIRRLLEIREDAVFHEITTGENDHTNLKFNLHLGREEGVCEILNELEEAGDVTREQLWDAFERGRDRGWAARKEMSA